MSGIVLGSTKGIIHKYQAILAIHNITLAILQMEILPIFTDEKTEATEVK